MTAPKKERFFDEADSLMADDRLLYEAIHHWMTDLSLDKLLKKRDAAETLFHRTGITFCVYGEEEAEERIIPFDLIPRLIHQSHWDKLEKGLKQRIRAINMFLADIYGSCEVLKANIIPKDLIYHNDAYKPEMIGLKMPHDIWAPIAGIDIVRTGPDEFYVLEDNVRVPSGVSYMLENREIMLRIAPELFDQMSIAPVETYPDKLLSTLRSLAPSRSSREPTCVLLTPGPYNSAYYEHSFLANKAGLELVEGHDLFVDRDQVFMRTTQGPKKVDVIYRRLDDDFLDPLTFRPDSMLGVAGLMNACRAGEVTLANTVGTGIADDKAIYTYMPELIRFYLREEPLLKNVPTWRCREESDLKYVLEHLPELVVKEVAGSGGYGMLIGPQASKEELESFAAKLKKRPHLFIAQPTLALSTCPTLTQKGLAPRHVDLRPFVLSGGQDIQIVPGGLTRVALKEGSLVVNSSQGGGIKDTWVVE
jgi:uncharacterized circularly permuted ATP-grasp superfamily protein